MAWVSQLKSGLLVLKVGGIFVVGGPFGLMLVFIVESTTGVFRAPGLGLESK